MPKRLVMVPALLALCACGNWVNQGEQTPILPIESLLAQAELAGPDPGPGLAARAAALRARAASIAP
ncbi:hypothetical protein [Tabrizicola sp.]|uniref:hypothetical protein n=1 Tax=Tabrizicola sp. TaxID=2005166 RepID=UPI00260294C2|nr:hypothetical protein [Tabrizicola sp.]MDM7932109.1 hypothetical protein [Tabrizicola sp.]